MIVYEVNLEISNIIYNEYYQWLVSHIDQMLTFPGFSHVNIFKEYDTNKDSNYIYMTLHYFINSKENLENYLNNHAKYMREEGLQKFGKQFNATRRFFEVIQ